MIYLPSPKEGGGLPIGNLVSQLVHNRNTTRRGVRPLKALGEGEGGKGRRGAWICVKLGDRGEEGKGEGEGDGTLLSVGVLALLRRNELLVPGEHSVIKLR